MPLAVPTAPILWLAVLALTVARARAVSTSQFQSWYPQSGHIYAQVLNDNCSAEYAKYLTGNKNYSQIDDLGGGGPASVLTEPVVKCILTNVSEYVKSQISSSQVLLGVMPTVLALVGPKTDETAAFLLVARRPLLFLLLALASPSVYFSRAFKYPDPNKILTEHPMRLRQRLPRGWPAYLVTVLEYALVAGAVANMARVDYELGLQTICILMTEWTLAPFFWNILGLAIHLLGVVVMRMRLRRLEPDEEPSNKDIGFARSLGRLPLLALGWAETEFRMAAHQRDVRIDIFPGTQLYIVLEWFLSTCVIGHMILGTLIFASTLFIGPQDALTVVARYLASVMTCRLILMYELSGLREAHKRTNENMTEIDLEENYSSTADGMKTRGFSRIQENSKNPIHDPTRTVVV